MNEFPSIDFKSFDKGFRIFDDSVFGIDIDKTMDNMGTESSDEKETNFDPPIEMFREFVMAANGNSLEYITDTLNKFFHYAKSVPINNHIELYESGAAGKLFDVASSDNIELAAIAFGVILHITANTENEFGPFNNDEFLDFLTSFFHDGVDLRILALALACLSNYILDSQENKDKCIERFSIPFLIELFDKKESISVREEIAHLIYSYILFGISPEMGVDIIHFCTSLLANRIEYCYKYAIWTLLYIVRTNISALDVVYTEELLDSIDNKILSCNNEQTIGGSLMLLGLFVITGKEIKENNIVYAVKCLLSDNDFTQLQALFVIRQLLKFNPETISLMIKCGFYNNIYELLNGNTKRTTKIKAAQLFCNFIMRGGMEAAQRIFISNGVSQFVLFFGYDNKALTLHTIKALSELFRCAGFLEPREYRKFLKAFNTVGGFDALKSLAEDDDFDIVGAVDEFTSEFIDFDTDEIPHESASDDAE
jgi:hypothetical protein